MTEPTRNNNFTKKQLRGLDMVFDKAIKKYPLIKGWRLSPIYEKYSVSLYVDIYVDFFELANKFNYGVLNYWKKDLLQDPEKHSVGTMASYIGNEDGTPNFNSSERDEIFNKYYNLGREINEYVNKLYLLLPKEYIIHWKSSFPSNIPDDNFVPVSISFDTYIQKN